MSLRTLTLKFLLVVPGWLVSVLCDGSISSERLAVPLVMAMFTFMGIALGPERVTEIWAVLGVKIDSPSRTDTSLIAIDGGGIIVQICNFGYAVAIQGIQGCGEVHCERLIRFVN